MKCMNEGCGYSSNERNDGCLMGLPSREQSGCKRHTTTPTTSITVERLERYERITENAKVISDENYKLKEQIKELEQDKARLDWLEENFDDNISLVLNANTPWLIVDMHGDYVGATLREAITKAMQEGD